MEILYCDERIAVCIKPAGILSTDEDGGMPQMLREELKTACIRTVHRLDAAVSGVMVFARSQKAASLLSEQIRTHAFEKEYLAVIHGTPAENCGVMTDLLWRDSTSRKTLVVSQMQKDAKLARLSYDVLGTNGDLSLVRVHLHTGRTHQIRVQFSSRGWPLVGDKKYGLPQDDCPIALWSHRLKFAHPQTGDAVEFSANPPVQYPWTEFLHKKEVKL
ncbi:MAG: RNA pseudouridine synthase [Oscillospiraceae bacterium]|nr:RNA pseudouridine synthase [Oscillospiraceae bacterium]